MKRRILAPLIVILATSLSLSVADARPGAHGHGAPGSSSSHNATIVRGTWTGDLECLPTNAEQAETPGTFRVTCVAGTGYAGAFTGHSVITFVGTIDEAGNTFASYDETFYGVYLADGSRGSLRFIGELTVDGATLAFHAIARITGGSCDFAGSRGRIEYTGSVAGGGFTADWIRPPRSSSSALCVPSLPEQLAVEGLQPS